MNNENNKTGFKQFLSQNTFKYYLENPELARMWHHDRQNMPKPSPEEQKNLDFGHYIGKKAKELYPDGFEETRNLDINEHLENSMRLIKEQRIPLFELGFELDGNYARPDIMLPSENDSWELIEVKGTSHVHENDVKYTAYMYYVITSLGIKISRSYLMLLSKWVDTKTEIKAHEVLKKTDISEKVIGLQGYIKDAIASMREVAKK